MPLSRRRFLQSLGITLAAAYAGFNPRLALAQVGQNRFIPVQGRALHTAMLRSAPAYVAPIIRHLWEDEIFEVRAVSGKWFQTSEGYIAFEDAQPMIVEPASIMAENTPFWAEVSGAVAIVRAWCAVDAPLVTRIGHGGLMRAVDQIVTPEGGWYALADERGQRIGWSRSAVWSAIDWQDQPRNLELVVNRSQLNAEIRDGAHLQMQADVALGRSLEPGTYPITEFIPSQTLSLEAVRHGVPWGLRSGENLSIGGVYWHNRFGDSASGHDLQLPVILARELFPRLDRVIIV